MKLTVREYADRLNVSVQTIYKKIKRGDLTTVTENNTTLVVVDSSEFNQEVKQEVSNHCDELLELVKWQGKEIKRLTKVVNKAHKKEAKVLREFLGVYQKALEAPKKEEDHIDVSVEKSKKKKKKKKKKGEKK